jgi:hypothetical protein
VFKNAVINYTLRHVPKGHWNDLSAVCSWFSLPVIGSPVNLSYREFHLSEYPADALPRSLLSKFLDFCYPADLPNRDQQIECDRTLYWKNSSTFIISNKQKKIIGCVQIINRTKENKLPVEYAQIINPDGTRSNYDLVKNLSNMNLSEIYRCRRSFELSSTEAFNVLLMLFKAVWIYTVRTETAFTLISYDIEKPELQQLYVRKLAFHDPGIKLVFGDNPQQWGLLIKDWAYHEKSYATLGKTQFFIQTWCRMSLKKCNSPVKRQNIHKPLDALLLPPQDILFAETVTSSSNAKLKKPPQIN